MDEQIELQLDYRANAVTPFTRECAGDHGYDHYNRYCFYCGYDRGPKKYRALIEELELQGTDGARDYAAKLRKERD